MVEEGRIRQARIVEGKPYDSVKLGILREEWEQGSRSSIPMLKPSAEG